MAGGTLVFFQFAFLTSVAGLPANLAGSVLLVAKLWDAISDPLIGWLSDRTKSSIGRRLPWMIVNIVPFCALFFAMWIVPDLSWLQGWFPDMTPEQAQWNLFGYYVVVALLFNTFYTGLILPHSSLTAEFSRDYDERGRITAYRMGFNIFGTIGGLVLAAVIFNVLEDHPRTTQYGVLALAVTVVALIAMIWCIVGIWGAAKHANTERLRRSPDTLRDKVAKTSPLKAILSNRPFLLVCAIYLFSWMAMQFTAQILKLYVESWMQLSAGVFSILALCVQVTACLLIPLWSFIAIRTGKKAVFFYGMVFWLVAQTGLFFLQPGQEQLLFVLAVTAGVGISVAYLVPNAMLPDTIEYDEWMTGERREGVYYGCFVFLQKFALAIGTFIVGQVLSAAGYISSGPDVTELPEQPDSALLALRIAIGPLPAAALVLGMIAAALYPINKVRHQEMLDQLRERRLREEKQLPDS